LELSGNYCIAEHPPKLADLVDTFFIQIVIQPGFKYCKRPDIQRYMRQFGLMLY